MHHVAMTGNDIHELMRCGRMVCFSIKKGPYQVRFRLALLRQFSLSPSGIRGWKYSTITYKIAIFRGGFRLMRDGRQNSVEGKSRGRCGPPAR